MLASIELRDGSHLEVRPVVPEDKEALREGIQRLGRTSRYMRFLSPVGTVSAKDLRYLTEVDHHDHEALVAVDPDTRDGVGVARFVRLRDDPEAAEFAVAVADDWQGRGVGTCLLARLADRAREEGVRRFRGLMLADNRPMQDVLRMFGEPRVLAREGATVEVEVDLPEQAGAGSCLHSMLRAAACGDATLKPRADPAITGP